MDAYFGLRVRYMCTYECICTIYIVIDIYDGVENVDGKPLAPHRHTHLEAG